MVVVCFLPWSHKSKTCWAGAVPEHMARAGQQAWVVTRLAGMTGALLCLFELYRMTIGAAVGGVFPPVSVFHTVHAHCILILVSLAYYCVCKLCLLLIATQGSPGGQRVRQPAPPAKEFIITDISSRYRANAVSVSGRGVDDLGGDQNWHSNLAEARLTIRNVWVLVYGLGFVFFITGYCFLGVHPVCLTFIGFAVGVLSVDELLCPRREMPVWYITVRFIVLLAALVSLGLVSAPILEQMLDTYVESLDIYSMVFGMLFPFCSQFIIIIIRDSHRYTLGTVIEVCEFGFPFAAFLGVFHLCVAYGQRFQSDADAVSVLEAYQNSAGDNQTVMFLDYINWNHLNQTAIRAVIETDGPFLTFYCVAPLLMIPAVVCYVASALEGSAIDPLLSLTLALCVEHVSPSSPTAIIATVLCSLCTALRVMCEYRPPLLQGGSHSLQEESTQLPHRVVWTRPTMDDCEAETQELKSDPPDDHSNA